MATDEVQIEKDPAEKTATAKKNKEKRDARWRLNLRIKNALRKALLEVLEDENATSEQKVEAARLIQPLI